MKTTVVPAQVTTVEDKIAGNLSFSQLLLLTIPVFLDGALFVLMPPLLKLTAFKLVLGTATALICTVLAIRVKGKILLVWLAVISRYQLRARYYLFDKNDPYLRAEESGRAEPEAAEMPTAQKYPKSAPVFIPVTERVRLESAITDPRAKFHLKAEKGGLRVYIHEVKEESL